jgi:hypothetical protein
MAAKKTAKKIKKTVKSAKTIDVPPDTGRNGKAAKKTGGKK